MRLLIIAIAVLGLGISASGQDKAKIEKEVIKADRARDAAFDKGDGEAWAKHIADECRWTSLSTGEILQNKAERAANITKRGPTAAAKLSAEKFQIGETLVTQTGVYTASSWTMHFARVWQKQDGQWIMVALYVDSWPED